MTLADRTIAALRSNHDVLAALVPTLGAEQLTGPSGASEWTVADVLSHMGSGAEISLAGYRSALDGAPAPEQDFNQSVWDKWNARDPQAQADGFLVSNLALVEAIEALTPDQRENVKVTLGFVPFPLSIAAVLGLRLNEAAQHSWDVRVATDPTATLADDAADVLLELFAGDLGFLLGFTGKADAISEPTLVAVDRAGYGVAVTDAVSLTTDVSSPTATFSGEAEAFVRLLGGRLGPQYTPAGVQVSGNIDLDDLRRVFPGF